eukprot:GFUD01003374.1.p1 GENE.GFUD01003374.1~~GFUD01003374.1.p1  ORF type:complete len:129 (-),score=21.29 GFUD01003374.1:735-1121(-)
MRMENSLQPTRLFTANHSQVDNSAQVDIVANKIQDTNNLCMNTEDPTNNGFLVTSEHVQGMPVHCDEQELQRLQLMERLGFQLSWCSSFLLRAGQTPDVLSPLLSEFNPVGMMACSKRSFAPIPPKAV